MIEGDAEIAENFHRCECAWRTAADMAAITDGFNQSDLGGFYVDFSSRKHTRSKMVDLTILTETGQVRH